MPDALTGMMSMFSSGGGSGMGGLGPLMGLLGTGGNIFGDIQRNKVLQQQMDLTKKYANLTPAQVTAGIQGLEQPLSSGLTTSVGNVVGGQLAEKGLSQAPGIQSEALAQGLAPYQLQEQQLATDAYFKQLGLPISSRPSPFGPFPQQTNTSPIWQSMYQQYQNAPGNLGGSPYSSLLNDVWGGGGNSQPINLPMSIDPSTLASLGMLGGGGAGGGTDLSSMLMGPGSMM